MTKKSKTSSTASSKSAAPTAVDEDRADSSSDEELNVKEEEKQQMEANEAEDYDNENSEEEVRKIDHLMFVIHGVGQKMSERTGQTFVHGNEGSSCCSKRGALTVSSRCQCDEKDLQVGVSCSRIHDGHTQQNKRHSGAAHHVETGHQVWHGGGRRGRVRGRSWHFGRRRRVSDFG